MVISTQTGRPLAVRTGREFTAAGEPRAVRLGTHGRVRVPREALAEFARPYSERETTMRRLRDIQLHPYAGSYDGHERNNDQGRIPVAR